MTYFLLLILSDNSEKGDKVTEKISWHLKATTYFHICIVNTTLPIYHAYMTVGGGGGSGLDKYLEELPFLQKRNMWKVASGLNGKLSALSHEKHLNSGSSAMLMLVIDHSSTRATEEQVNICGISTV